MNLEIIKQKELPLVSRKRVSLWYNEKSATPSRKNLVKELAKMFKTKEDLIIIKHIYPQFGKNKTKIIAHLYADKSKMEFFEHKSLIKKHSYEDEKEKTGEQPLPEEKKEESIKEEKPATEKKGESNKEE
ncbi:hypothetical protein JXB41_09055 [Candidatus Woesearchaeota archaeon]|nr:hypothetical protein [Candidatus Woesearchaeota archaeon]